MMTMRRLLVCGLILNLSMAICNADDFRDLFNGRDLSGWVYVNTPPDTWSVQNGMLVCTGKPIGEIRTDRMYQNFIMEVEWRHLVPGGNAGIFVWADDLTARGVPFHRGIEVQVLENAYGQSRGHTTHGDIFPIHGATMDPENGRGGSRAFPTEERSKASPEWNHYRIECRDGQISLAVNGKVVTRGKNCNPRKGYICLESEGGVVHYRNLRIQELPETPVSQELTAIADRGYKSLYSGLDLRGWTGAGVTAGWEVKDWVLSCSGGNNAGALESDAKMSAGGFLLDIKASESTRAITVCGFELAEKLQPGKWRRLELRRTEQEIVCVLDGEEVARRELTGPTSLTLNAVGAVDFANLFVRTK